MTNRPDRQSDGHYHIKGKKYPELFGSRIQVLRGSAYKTAGGLLAEDLMMNKHGRVVSVLKHKTAKKERRLEKAGYFTKKGKFGFVKRSTRKNRKSSKKR
jgi:hypothetical protein